MPEPAQPRLVGAAQRPAAGQVERTERVAVIRAPAPDDDPAVGLAPCHVIGAGHLERRLDRLRATRHRIHRRVVHGQVRTQGGHPALQWLGREHRAVGICHAAGLLGHDPGDGLPAVADVDHDGATRGVEVRPAVRVGDGAAGRAGGDRRTGDRRAKEDAGGQGRDGSRSAQSRPDRVPPPCRREGAHGDVRGDDHRRDREAQADDLRAIALDPRHGEPRNATRSATMMTPVTSDLRSSSERDAKPAGQRHAHVHEQLVQARRDDEQDGARAGTCR